MSSILLHGITCYSYLEEKSYTQFKLSKNNSVGNEEGFA